MYRELQLFVSFSDAILEYLTAETLISAMRYSEDYRRVFFFSSAVADFLSGMLEEGETWRDG